MTSTISEEFPSPGASHSSVTANWKGGSTPGGGGGGGSPCRNTVRI